MTNRDHRTAERMSGKYPCRMLGFATQQDVELERCHCGELVCYGFDGDPTHERGMCQHCDQVRCDAYPGECGRR